MNFNIDFLEKLNILKFENFLFIYNFIKKTFFFLRVPNIKKEKTFNLIKYFIGFEYWSNNKVLIKKINFFYKVNKIFICFFFKVIVLNIINWLYYFKLIFLPYYLNFLNEYIYYRFFKNYLVFSILNIYKINIILNKFKNLKLIKYIILFYTFFKIKNFFKLLFINIFKNFINYNNILLWSIYI